MAFLSEVVLWGIVGFIDLFQYEKIQRIHAHVDNVFLGKTNGYIVEQGYYRSFFNNYLIHLPVKPVSLLGVFSCKRLQIQSVELVIAKVGVVGSGG